MIRFILVLLAMVPLSACGAEEVPQSQVVGGPEAGMRADNSIGNAANIPAPPQKEGACVKPMNLIGQSAKAIETMDIQNPIRILGPDTPATMDFAPGRTNFMTDDQGIIREIRCG